MAECLTVILNYGGVASSNEPEVFGTSALGICVDQYYASLCGLPTGWDADKVANDGAMDVEPLPRLEM